MEQVLCLRIHPWIGVVPGRRLALGVSTAFGMERYKSGPSPWLIGMSFLFITVSIGSTQSVFPNRKELSLLLGGWAMRARIREVKGTMPLRVIIMIFHPNIRGLSK